MHITKKTLRNIRSYINNWPLFLAAIVIPSSSFIGILQRILFLSGNLLLSRKSVLLVITGVTYMVLKYTLLNEIELAHFGIIAGLISTENIVNNRTKVSIKYETSVLLLLLSVSSVFFNYFLQLDPNYLSFALFMTAILVKTSGHMLGYRIILLSSIFLYSRLYIITLIIYLILEMSYKKTAVIKSVRRPFLFTYMAYIIYLLFTGYLLYFLLGGKIPDYIELTGFNRLTRLVDTSNWIRFTANFRMLSSLDLPSIFFGFVGPIVFPEFPVKNIYPHNLFLGLAYNVGFIWSLLFLSKLINVSSKVRSLFIPILFYQLVLGFGSYYMFVLPLLALIVNSYEESIINRR